MKLELKHLAPYLPYELKWSLQELSTFVMSGITSQTLYTESGTVLTWIKHPDLPVALFPLLRPLSDLTKEIEINGEKFVPVKKLHEKGEKFSSELIVSHYIKKVYLTKGYDHIPHWMFQDLIKWHFDVFGLIDQKLALPLI